MAKKILGYTRLIWTCPRCDTRNPGPNQFCNGCGGPQPEGVRFEQPAESELITDADELARAKAGPDRHCPYCGARNRADAKFCGACGGDLAEGKARQSGQVVGAYRAPSGATRPCPACGTPNLLTAMKCSNCGSALPAQEAPKPGAVAKGAAAPRRVPPLILGGVVGLLCLAGAAALIFGLRREELTAEVEQVRWERSIEVEAVRPVERTAWQDEVPAGARDLSCELAYSGTEDNPAPVATEVCGTPYTIDEGSGYAQVVQDCAYRVYEMQCRYTVDEWTVVDRLAAGGEDLNPRWPSIALGPDEREGLRSESYRVTFAGEADRFTYSPATEGEFAMFGPGSRWQLTVSGLGGVTSVEPAP